MDNDTLALHAIDLEAFEERSQNRPTPLLSGGSHKDGHVLTGTTDEVEAFLLSQPAAPGFFEGKPLYSF